MVQITRSINYQATLVKIIRNYWDEALLLFGFMMLLTYLSSTENLEVARQGLFDFVGLIGGSALLGYILISIGGAVIMIPAGWTQIAGAIMIAIGWILAGASIVAVWAWIKNNILLAIGLLFGVILLWYRMRAPKKPIQNIYYVQSPSRRT